MFFVYILGCLETKRTYVGQTDHLLRRYRMHCEGTTRTSREKLRAPVVLYFEIWPTRAAAMQRERHLKQGSGYRLRRRIADESFRLWDSIAASEIAVDTPSRGREFPPSRSTPHGGCSSVG